jgi:hypothetical protein
LRFSITDFIAKNKTNIIITILVIVSMLLLLKFPARNNIITKTFLNDDEVEYDDALISDKNDSLEKYGLCAIENIIIEANAKVRRTPNIARYNTLYELKFGTKVYTKVIDAANENHIYVDASLVERETKNGFLAIYAVKPITLSEKPVGYVAIEDIILKSEFKNFKPKPKRMVLDAEIVAAIDRNLLIDGIRYKFIEDNERFNNTITFGDFNNDEITDFAVVLDTEDNSDSVFLVFFMDVEKKSYRLVFTNAATAFLKINTIPKQTNITFKLRPMSLSLFIIFSR